MLYVLMSRLGQQGKTTIARHVLAAHLGTGSEDVLTIESSTTDGGEGLLLQADRDQAHAEALGLMLTSLSAEKKAQVVDVGNTDVEQALPAVIAHAKAGNKIHAILPLTEAPKAPRSVAELAGQLQAVPGLLVTVVFNDASDQDAPASMTTTIDVLRKHGAELLPVALVGNAALTLKTAAEIKAVASVDVSGLTKKMTEARAAKDMQAIVALGAEHARISKAKSALENTRAVFEAIKAREA
jgi:hypothetical protein